MSEKRFYLGNNDTTICDRSQGGSDGFNMLTIFKVVDLLNEQQATISQLQDLCGESDGENAKLRIENKRLQEENEQLKHYKLYEDNKRLQTIIADLKEENEQLRKQQQRLYNYFRNYLEDEMSAENFGEMWDNVKEDERWNE